MLWHKIEKGFARLLLLWSAWEAFRGNFPLAYYLLWGAATVIADDWRGSR